MKTSRKSMALLGVLVLLLAGCSSSGSSDSSGGSDYNTGGDTSTDTDTDTDTETDTGTEDEPEAATAFYISETAVCQADGDFEGAFTEETTVLYLECVIPGVDAWIDTVYNDMPHPAGYVYVPQGVVGSAACGEYNDKSAYYCPTDNEVYLGHETVWGFYDVLGDASLPMVVAHEVTHHFQIMVGTYTYLDAFSPEDGVAPEHTVFAENQADCGAGAYMAYLDRMGALDGEDDLNDLTSTLSAIASVESDGRDHGTLTERIRSFNMAFNSTQESEMMECNAIMPDHPILG